MNARALGDMERVFRALADVTRLRILGLLLTGEVCVCHIHESLRISQPKASRHLAYLRKARLVETRRHGPWVYYRMARLPDPVLAGVHRAVTQALVRLDRIRKDVGRLGRITGCCLPPEAPLLLPRIERARGSDGPAICRLLEENNLPVAGILDHLGSALVARADGRVVGASALEVYADGALLRSVAVDSALRGQGLGAQLTERALELARAQGVAAVYLLTTTAERFFPKFGFARIDRHEVPAAVRESVEFRSACPSTAIVMSRRLR